MPRVGGRIPRFRKSYKSLTYRTSQSYFFLGIFGDFMEGVDLASYRQDPFIDLIPASVGFVT